MTAVGASVHRCKYLMGALHSQPRGTGFHKGGCDCGIVDAFEIAELAEYVAFAVDESWIDQRSDSAGQLPVHLAQK